MDFEQLARSPWIHALVGIALTALGVVASVIGSIPGIVVGLDTVAGYALAIVLSEAGFAAVALAFVVATGRGLRYLDLDVDIGVDVRAGWGLVAAVTAGALLFRFAAVYGAFAAGIEPSAPTLTEVELPFETQVFVLLPAMLLVVGPAEELLFRGVIQKYLRESFSARGAILGAGVLFGAIHVLSIQLSAPLGAAVTLAVVTVVGVAFGWLYERTGSLPAAMLAHGVYNAAIVLSAYVLEFVV